MAMSYAPGRQIDTPFEVEEFDEAPAQASPGMNYTTLDRDDYRKTQAAPAINYTTLGRDDYRKTQAGPPPAKSQAYRQSSMPRPASTRAKSILRTPEDQQMAMTQLNRDTLVGKEAEEQDEWAKKMIALIPNACPDNKAFERSDIHPAYICTKGGHAVTDALLAEGMAGIMAAPKGPGKHNYEDFEGPFYLDSEVGQYFSDDPKWRARKMREQAERNK